MAAPEQRNEVKISHVVKKSKTTNGKSVINGYVLMQKLGAGAFGTVRGPPAAAAVAGAGVAAVARYSPPHPSL